MIKVIKRIFYIMLVVAFAGIVNITVFTSYEDNSQKEMVKEDPLKENVPVEYSEIKKVSKKIKTEKILKLIDDNNLTVENIKKIDSIYPDSICDCNTVDFTDKE